MRMEVIGIRRELAAPRFSLGTIGHLGIFLWSLLMVMLAPEGKLAWMAGIPLSMLILTYPGAWRRALTGRRLLLLALIVLPPLLLAEDADAGFSSLGISPAGLKAALQIAVRFVVVMVALEGMTSKVEIAALAGILERMGLNGLGFSVGVAMNLLPCLQKSCTQSWQTLKMRGGLRKQWWRGLRLFALTASSCALLRSEEIALAAEARGFDPENIRQIPIESGWVDWGVIVLGAVALAVSLAL